MVEVGCRNFFPRLGMKPASLAAMEPGVSQRNESTDWMRCSGFPLKQQLWWVQGAACESLSSPIAPLTQRAPVTAQ